jgi:hypothetical protein
MARAVRDSHSTGATTRTNRTARRAARAVAVLVTLAVAPVAAPAAQSGSASDLDEFMARVLARRDESWKTLQQYILEERELVQLVGPGDSPLYGSRREYTWFPRDGVFIRSPLRVDGVLLDDAARRRAEADWLRREEQRERRRAAAREDQVSAESPGPAETGSSAEVLRQSVEPQFVSAAYFLRFRFDPGQYALVGREQLDGRDVLRIEYYPTTLFRERPPQSSEPQPRRQRQRDPDPDLTRRMNKTSLVTLWIVPDAHQILRYEFDNVDLDFLPGRALVRIDEIRASMQMHEPFPGVWLPQSVAMRFNLVTAAGAVNGRYEVDYHDYRLAEVTTRIR